MILLIKIISWKEEFLHNNVRVVQYSRKKILKKTLMSSLGTIKFQDLRKKKKKAWYSFKTLLKFFPLEGGRGRSR